MDSLKERIVRLESSANRLEPDKDQLESWNRSATSYGSSFIQTIQEQAAFGADYSVIDQLDHFPIQATGRSLEELIRTLQETVDTPGVRPAMPGHLGYIPGGGVYSSALADYISAFTDHFAGMYFAGPGAVKIENQLIKWMCDLIGYPQTAFGNLPSGGSIANLTAIATARHAKAVNSTNVRRSVVYMTKQTHHCVHKALRILGLDECVWRDVGIDEDFKMNVEDLGAQLQADREEGLNPFLIVASAGTTDVGSVDPIDAIAAVAEQYQCWFHIDAAYGGFFILVDELKPLFKGIERADSVVMDPHKTLFLPYGSGALLVKDRSALLNLHRYQANYLQDAGDRNPYISPAEAGPELTKHFRGLRMWLPLQLHGLAPFTACLEEKWLLTLYFYQRVQDLGFLVGPKPELSVCIYRYELDKQEQANTFNLDLSHRIRENSTYFISTTTIAGVVWLRLAVANFRTHLSHIDEYLEVLQQEVQQLLASQCSVKI